MTLAIEKRRPWLRAFAWLILLGSFFFVSYGFANWVTSQRGNVPSLVFGWERRVPFWPWTIVPYWSSDLLYALSLAVCSTRRELDTHGKRLFAAQAISILCFLAFPLRCLFVRPETVGVFGRLFAVLNGFDQPFNQAPSLHISLAVVLWSCFRKHSRGLWQILIGGWLVLIAVSTMTTWQHQFIDLPTGLLAGSLAIALIPNADSCGRRGRRIQMAIFYLSGSALCEAGALKVGGAGWFLTWPAMALFVVSVAYLTDRPGIFQKRRGAMNPLMATVLGPYMAAAWVNSRWWTRTDAPALEICEGVWLGRAPGLFDYSLQRFRSIVDLTAELSIQTGDALYQGVAMLDLITPTGEQMRQAVLGIENFRRERPTLVCCALGFARSASAIAAWLVQTGKARDAEDAIKLIRLRQPRIIINDETQVLINSFVPAEASPASRI